MCGVQSVLTIEYADSRTNEQSMLTMQNNFGEKN